MPINQLPPVAVSAHDVEARSTGGTSAASTTSTALGVAQGIFDVLAIIPGPIGVGSSVASAGIALARGDYTGAAFRPGFAAAQTVGLGLAAKAILSIRAAQETAVATEIGVPVGTRLARGLIAGEGPGAALRSSMMTENQIALKDLVNEATLRGRTPLSAENT
jgi:hypothetical protein